MAVSEKLILDLSEAISQVDDLERQLDGLLQPIVVPVDIESTGALQQLQAEINAADNLEIDVDIDDEEIGRAERELEDFREESERTERELEDLEEQSERTGRTLRDIGTQGQSAFRGITGGLLAFGGALAAFQGARALGSFFADSISAASDFEESLSKTQVVFGQFSEDIEGFANTAPEALGLSSAAALEFTSTFGNLFVALGLSQEAAADLSPEIVQLGADLASFNNIDPTEALDKLRAGLVGEAEPLRALGVNLTAATTNAKAMELGLADASGEVSEAAKVQARYALILEQTATAQGDVARTSDSIANQQRAVTAEFENFRRDVGEGLVGLYATLLDLAPGVLESLENLIPALESLATSIANAADDLPALIDFFSDLTRTVPGAVGDVTALGQALLDLSPLQLLGGVDNFTESITRGFGRIADVADGINLSQLESGLIAKLEAGEDATIALEQQLTGLNTINLSNADDQLDTLAGAAEAFARIADVDRADLQTLSASFLELGEDAGFTAREITAIRASLAEVANEGRNLDLGILRFDRTESDSIDEVTESISVEAAALEDLSVIADEAGVSLGTLLSNTEAIPPEFQALADSVSGSSVEFLQAVDRLDEVKDEIGTLPGAMEAAGAALRDEEGEIVADFGMFFDNLRSELAAREDFEGNLAILRALGLDNLAATFDQAGLEAAPALADAVENLAEAAAADAQLEGFGESLGGDLIQGVKDAIADKPVTQDLVDNIIAAAQSADTPEVRAALQALANQLLLQIPSTILPPTNGVDIKNFLPEFTAAPGGGNVVNNNFFTEPNPTTDTARIEQATSSVIGLAR